MEIEYYNGDDNKATIKTEDILEMIGDFGDGPLEFETKHIEGLIRKLESLSKQLEHSQALLKDSMKNFGGVAKSVTELESKLADKEAQILDVKILIGSNYVRNWSVNQLCEGIHEGLTRIKPAKEG